VVEWAIPTAGLVVLHPEECKVIETAYTDSAILATDTVIVTGQSSNAGLNSPPITTPGGSHIGVVPTNDGKNLRWSATVDNGSVRLTACNNPLQKYQSYDPLSLVVYLNGRKVNILVVR
jgi:hypothetical protein